VAVVVAYVAVARIGPRLATRPAAAAQQSPAQGAPGG
jgi:hypothetical protein